ncbi:MAG: 3-phenylpropionate/cinnamic acid dioxygenase subunit beta [Proteobacteria bacterium]|nr:3-phenylpropionate/cinnamic acid dioxygenase subunit beta [Pseudomonadota bacterium]
MASLANLPLAERMQVTFEAQEFTFHEAALLDNRQYEAWLDLLTDDIHYWMPIRRTTTLKEVSDEFTQRGGMAFFDDDKNTLTRRVNRLSLARAWAEDPPSRTRRLVTNLQVVEVSGDEIQLHANFQLYRTRLNSEEDNWIGRREDLLRRVGGVLKLARRHIYLEQTVILSQNMSSLF